MGTDPQVVGPLSDRDLVRIAGWVLGGPGPEPERARVNHLLADHARLRSEVAGYKQLVRGLVNAVVPDPPLLDPAPVYIDVNESMPGGWSYMTADGFQPLADARPDLVSLLDAALLGDPEDSSRG